MDAIPFFVHATKRPTISFGLCAHASQCSDYGWWIAAIVSGVALIGKQSVAVRHNCKAELSHPVLPRR
jgi:hypothetical protein